MDIKKRRQVVECYANNVRRLFPQTDQYNILVFGSFLTGRYTDKSDIDIGIFSLLPGISFRLYNYTKDYFDQLGIKNDVIRMKLLESQYINIPIITGQKYAVTDYCPPELIDYIKMMIDRYGENPQETIVRQMRQEVLA